MARSTRWGPDDIGDLTGRTAVVTGANSGIGFEAAVELAAHGAHVVLACRDQTRAAGAADRIVGAAPRASVELLALDLSSLDSVRAAAGRLTTTHDRLDILVNNAGVMGSPFRLTADGFELQMATNHLGPFAFTGLVLDTLLRTGGSRVVTVSSLVHRVGRLPAAMATGGAGRNRWRIYGDTKLANLAFTYELERRLRAAGTTTVAVAAHPGWARTNLAANGPVVNASGLRARAGVAAARLGQSAAAGALPTLYAATSPDVRGGDFVGPAHLGGLVGPPERVRSNRRSHRGQDALALWRYSEEATGVRFAFDTPAADTPADTPADRPAPGSPGGGGVTPEARPGGGGTSR